MISSYSSREINTRPEKEPQDVFDVNGVEELARNGFETHTGIKKLEFRVGTEIEFQIGNPDRFRKEILDKEEIADATKNQWKSEILNKNTLYEASTDNSDLVEEFKQYTKGFIKHFVPKDQTEEETKAKWLEQTDKFKTGELINFLLYEEFSKPQLGIPALKENATLNELDDFSSQNGWIEWRFGTGSLQSGYYDNVGMSEIRLCPTNPTEALRRIEIIKGRMKELGEQFGALIRTSVDFEHINLSAYDIAEPTKPSIFGNDAIRSAGTVDAVSGIMRAHQDGINLNPNVIKRYDYMFSKNSEDSLRVGPTRKTLRVLNNRIELRGGFSSTSNGIAWLTAGTIEGLINGSDGLKEMGYTTAEYLELFEVQRSLGFIKEQDLEIQRTFENSIRTADGGFDLNDGYEMINGDSIEQEFFGDVKHSGFDARIVIAATLLKDDGTPYVTAESLISTHMLFPKNYLKLVGGVDTSQMDKIVTVVNSRFQKIKILPRMAVAGESIRAGADMAETIAKVRGSKVVSLALGPNIDNFVTEIEEAAEEFNSSMDKD